MNIKIIAVFVLIALVGGVGAYLVASNLTKTPTPSSLAASSPTPSLTPALSDSEQIKAALVEKNQWNSEDVAVDITKNDGTYAKGLVSSTITPHVGGGLVFAAKVNENWQIVWDGNGMILCSDLTDYPNFPKDYIPACFDKATEKLINR
jgi:hypothetical protein